MIRRNKEYGRMHKDVRNSGHAVAVAVLVSGMVGIVILIESGIL